MEGVAKLGYEFKCPTGDISRVYKDCDYTTNQFHTSNQQRLNIFIQGASQ